MPGSQSLLRKFSKRRRPQLVQSKLIRNPIFAEDENYSISEVEDSFYTGPSKPKSKSIMNRISNWIGEHLGNKNKRRDGRRSDSETRPQIVGPVIRDSGRKVPQMFGNSPVDHYSNSSFGTDKQYEVKRRAVCTNPWFYPDSARSMMSTSLSRNTDMLDAMYSSSFSHLTRDESLQINTLAGSASCSSGYGSNDSSPECSVHQPHWQPSSQIENRGDLIDKAVECHSLDLDEHLGIPSIDNEDGDYSHIYYELEPTLSQLKTQVAAYDDSCYSGSVELNTNEMSASTSRSDSPIYAIPCSSSAGESRCGSIEYVDDSDGYAELAKRCQPEPPLKNPPVIVERNGNGYARLQRQTDRPSAFTRCVPRLPSPKFYAPPPPPIPRTCLDLLDEQIAELKMKTEVVSRLVESAKERRELRDYARNLCMEHIKDLRNLRLYVERGFELHI